MVAETMFVTPYLQARWPGGDGPAHAGTAATAETAASGGLYGQGLLSQGQGLLESVHVTSGRLHGYGILSL